MTSPKIEVEQLCHIADLLIGAAYADQRFTGQEREKIKEMLMELSGGIPKEVLEHIRGFDAKAFDAAQTAGAFRESPALTKRRLLELIAAVHEADEELDLDENEYLIAVAKALGMSEADYKDLRLEIISIEELKEGFTEIVVPPLPEG
jgi:uncharacterized tellurite resistance protein B-like protein